jgi:hypothetical protein
MLFPPANTSLEPVLTVVFPDVFPTFDTPAERFWLVASTRHPELDAATVTNPAPAIESVRAS